MWTLSCFENSTNFNYGPTQTNSLENTMLIITFRTTTFTTDIAYVSAAAKVTLKQHR